MTTAFTLASWNVEHFKDDPARVDRVVGFLAALNPDVFALYEVEGKEVFQTLVSKMPGYSFHITEGPQVQEILVGAASHLTAFFTQKLEFKAGLQFLRPGALLTVTIEDESYPILFLHTKSGVEPLGLGLRDDMLRRALDFKDTLEAAPGGQTPANYLFLGDLNTMGMEYAFLRERDIDADQEIEKMRRFAEDRNMRVLEKDSPSWWNGPGSSIPPSNLDQVIAADHLSFTDFGGFQVRVEGWPKQPTEDAKADWIRDFSDHGCLFLEVQRP